MDYKTVGQLNIPQNLDPQTQSIVDEIARKYANELREIDKQKRASNIKNVGGSIVSAASFLPFFNVPYVGTGIGGAMYDLGQGIAEGDKLPELAKRTGRGFIIGETIGAVPYVGKAASKTKAGQAAINKVASSKLGQATGEIIDNATEKFINSKAYDALMSEFAPGRALYKNTVLPYQRKISAGINPLEKSYKDVLYDAKNPIHQKQWKIIKNTNPMLDDYHTGIRSADDIFTFEDIVKNHGIYDYTPDFTEEMINNALKSGKIKIYSSYPIETGGFVTPSLNEAKAYAGKNKIYSKEVPINDVAWIDNIEGQYAPSELSYLYDDIKGKPLKYTGDYVTFKGVDYPEVSLPMNEYARNMSDLETYIGQNKLQNFKDILQRYYPEYNLDAVLDKTKKPRIINIE